MEWILELKNVDFSMHHENFLLGWCAFFNIKCVSMNDPLLEVAKN